MWAASRQFHGMRLGGLLDSLPCPLQGLLLLDRRSVTRRPGPPAGRAQRELPRGGGHGIVSATSNSRADLVVSSQILIAMISDFKSCGTAKLLGRPAGEAAIRWPRQHPPVDSSRLPWTTRGANAWSGLTSQTDCLALLGQRGCPSRTKGRDEAALSTHAPRRRQIERTAARPRDPGAEGVGSAGLRDDARHRLSAETSSARRRIRSSRIQRRTCERQAGCVSRACQGFSTLCLNVS
jgi:hypothetical protein